MQDYVGQQLGHYWLLRQIGKGGFASVYLGEHLHLGTQAAIKVLSTHLVEADSEQFRTEASMIARLEHPHIVRVLDFGFQDGLPFLVMSYAPNGTLRQRYARGSRLPLPTIISYTRQVASALQFAHERKVIHRDVKPENILLGNQGELLLSDFGIALMGQSSQYQDNKGTAGTIAYMAPEQLQGKPRRASDQYSLGIVVYEWLCGELPFQGTALEIALQHQIASPPPLREKIQPLSPAVEHVVLKALEKDPERRFESVQAFAMALERASQESARMAFFPGENTVAVATEKITSPHSAISTSSSDELPTVSLPPALPHRRWSRRIVLLAGSACVGIVLAGGGVTWFAAAKGKEGPSPTAVPAHKTAAPTLPHPGTMLVTYTGHRETVFSVAWSRDDRWLASASQDRTVQVWNANTGNNLLLTYTGHAGPVYSVAWAPNGKWIASASHDYTVQVWDASAGGTLQYKYTGHSNAVWSAAWSRDGKWIASASEDHTVQVWNALTGANLIPTYTGHSGPVYSVVWSPDGRWLASASNDSTVQVWDAKTGGSPRLTYTGHHNGVWSVAWSPDGKRLASASSDHTVQVWNASTGGNPLLTYTGHSGPVYAVAWSRDGKWIASASGDNSVQVWDASTGDNLLPKYTGHSGPVASVAWSLDDQRLACGSVDSTVQVFEG